VNVLVLCPHPYGVAPGPRTSIELWRGVLEGAGIHLTYATFGSPRLHEVLYRRGYYATKALEMVRAYAGRLRLLRDLGRYDAVFVYREAALVGPAFLERLVVRRGKPLIYIVDDPLYVPYVSPFNGWLSYLKCFGKVAEICRMSKVVIVNSSHHREFASRYNRNVWFVPSVVDTDQYTYRPGGGRRGPPCIGWSGSPSTAGNVTMLADVLRTLAGRVRHRVHLIGAPRFDLPGVRHTAQPWKADTEVDDLRQLDVGLVPLPCNEWNKRKFNLKVVQYMALGIPPVCTPLGDNRHVIQPGVNGFLAGSPDEWLDCLTRLARDESLRAAVGRRAAAEARDKYSLRANAANIVGAFRSALA
jgi:glycosyltransferase involved in cell wall biosynthesis